jgi:xanthine dehydrogenase accessory factor
MPMRKLLPATDRWHAQGKAVALATVVKIYGSAPQPLGAKMAISDAGEMAGSVSGGCVEGAVVQEALAVLASGTPRLVVYGIADELAVSVGLACGGTIEVWIEPFRPTPFVLDVRDARMAAQATIVKGKNPGATLALRGDGTVAGSLGDRALDEAANAAAREAMAVQQAVRCLVETKLGTVDMFIDVEPPPPRLIVVGAVHIAIPLVTFAKVLGFHTIVLDARTAFATPERFGHADLLRTGWPADALPQLDVDEATCFVILTHDEKIDDPALVFACRSPARYIGALGSRRTHADRVARLKEAGLTDAEVARIRAPIGLDIGARRPEEIAVAIMAEIVAAVNGKRT